jgi:hypothetical protein
MTLIELVVILAVSSLAGALVGSGVGLFSSVGVVHGAQWGCSLGCPGAVALLIIAFSVSELRRPR